MKNIYLKQNCCLICMSGSKTIFRLYGGPVLYETMTRIFFFGFRFLFVFDFFLLIFVLNFIYVYFVYVLVLP